MPPDTTHHENSGADEPNKAPLRTTLAGGLSAPIPVDEQARLAALRRYDLSDPATKASLEELCALAAAICQVPLAFVSLVEEAREVFAVAVGSDEADSPRDISFCGHAIVQKEELFVVPDTHTDPRFAKNPNVLGGARIRFYAGMPLRTRDGFAIGALCVKDTAPRELGPQQLDALAVLGRQVVAQLERKSDEMLARSLASIVDAYADAVLSVDRNGIVLTWNTAAEALFGFSAQEMVGATLAPVLPGRITPLQQDRIDRLLNGEKLEVSDGRMRRKDGSDLTISASLAPVFDASGVVKGFAGVIRDVSEQRRVEGRLRQSQKMEAIGNLAGGIAHDFNNILTVIRGNTELLLKECVEHGHGDRLREIDSSAALAAALTGQLLTFSRQQMVRPEPVSVNDVTAATCDLLDRVIGKDVRLDRHFDADLDVISMDKAQLQQVVLNLCVNGRDAMPAGGVVTVRTANVVLDDLQAAQHIDIAPGPYVLLEITDSGVGMDLETQRRAFDPFFTTKLEGTGLGLSTVFGAVRQAGGTIAVYSELGTGTSFKVYLPQASIEDLPTAKTEIQVTKERSATILLVEDFDVLRTLAVQILESVGHRVLAAASGREALSLFDEHPDEIDLLLTDMMMPQMSGKELADILLKKRPDLRIIFTSGYPSETAIDNNISSKRVAFIQKPYTTPELSRQIQAVLASLP